MPTNLWGNCFNNCRNNWHKNTPNRQHKRKPKLFLTPLKSLTCLLSIRSIRFLTQNLMKKLKARWTITLTMVNSKESSRIKCCKRESLQWRDILTRLETRSTMSREQPAKRRLRNTDRLIRLYFIYFILNHLLDWLIDRMT